MGNSSLAVYARRHGALMHLIGHGGESLPPTIILSFTSTEALLHSPRPPVRFTFPRFPDLGATSSGSEKEDRKYIILVVVFSNEQQPVSWWHINALQAQHIEWSYEFRSSGRITLNGISPADLIQSATPISPSSENDNLGVGGEMLTLKQLIERHMTYARKS